MARWGMIGLTAALMLAGIGEAAAETVRLGPKRTAKVFIWTSDEAKSEAMQLLAANVQKDHPELIARLIACVVPKGTAAVVTEYGIFASSVIVVEGDHAGCRGSVASEDVLPP